MRQFVSGGAALLLLILAAGRGAEAVTDRPDLPSLMRRQAPQAAEPAPVHLPSVAIESVTAAFPLNDRLNADAVFDRPFTEALRSGLVWYLEQHGVRVVKDEAELRLSGVLVGYEGWKRPGRWGAGVTLRTRLYQGHKVLITDSLESTLIFPSEEAALPEEGGEITAEQALFTRIGLSLSEQVLALIRRAAPAAPASAVPASTRAAPPAPLPRPIERGVLTVAASVEHAEVFIDGALIGTTPLVDLILPAGPHELQVKKNGFRIWSRRIHVVERAASRFFAEMEPERETR